jgi:hypothetical protein
VLVGTGSVARTGTGKRGDPFQYLSRSLVPTCTVEQGNENPKDVLIHCAAGGYSCSQDHADPGGAGNKQDSVKPDTPLGRCVYECRRDHRPGAPCWRQIAADGSDLVLTAPRPLSTDLLDRLKAHNSEVIEALDFELLDSAIDGLCDRRDDSDENRRALKADARDPELVPAELRGWLLVYFRELAP